MTQNSADKTPEQLTEEIIRKAEFLPDAYGGLSLTKNGFLKLKQEIAAAIAFERSKQQAVVCPSEEEMLNAIFCGTAEEFAKAMVNRSDKVHVACLHGKSTKHNLDILLKMYRWLQSQVKPFTVPEFTDEEILTMADKYTSRNDDAHYGFQDGFKAALKMIKESR